MPNPLTIFITVHIMLNYPPSAEDSQICISSLILVPEIQIHRLAIWLSYTNFIFTMVSIYLLTCPIAFRATPPPVPQTPDLFYWKLCDVTSSEVILPL